MTVRFLFSLILLLTLGCTQAPERPAARFRTVATVEQLMDGVMAPSAEFVFKSVGSIFSAEGEKIIQPANDEEWEEVRNRALAVAEAGNLLLIDGRAKDQEDWIKFVNELMDRAVGAATAAERKDPDELFEAGGQIYETCTACHTKYIKPSPENP